MLYTLACSVDLIGLYGKSPAEAEERLISEGIRLLDGRFVLQGRTFGWVK